MFCPSCNSYLTESKLFKTNLKKYENADLEYHARCMICEKHIGRMFWGKLSIAPELLSSSPESGVEAAPPPPQTPAENSTPEPAEPEEDEEPFAELFELEFEVEDEVAERGQEIPDDKNIPDKYAQYPPPPGYYYCPHCNGRLPENRDEIPFRS